MTGEAVCISLGLVVLAGLLAVVSVAIIIVRLK